MKIGSHVNNSGELMLLNSAMEAVNYGANCFMVYLGAPQNTYRKPVELLNGPQMHAYCQEHGIASTDIVVHAPYIINLAQSDPHKQNFAIDFLTSELKMCAELGLTQMVIHPGAHVGMGMEQGLNNIIHALQVIINNTRDVRILIETMAGKGSECCSKFYEVATIIKAIDNPQRLGVCLDTCHIHDAGYDIVNHYEEVMAEFDREIGFANLGAIHLNDSYNELASHKDRHANIGMGKIGLTALKRVVDDPRFQDIPIILETPYIKNEDGTSYPPYQAEIALLKTKM